MSIVILIFTLLLAVAVQCVPFFSNDTYRLYLQAFAGVAAFLLGMTQSTFGRYMADAMTDRRRQKEKETEENKRTDEENVRFSPLLQMIRNCLGGNESEFGNNYDVILMPGDLVFGGGGFLRVNAGSEYEKMKSMVNRLGELGHLTITKRDQNYVRFRMDDKLYGQILKFKPAAV